MNYKTMCFCSFENVFPFSLSLFIIIIFFSGQELQKLLKLQILMSLTCLPLCLAVDESLGRGVCNPDGEQENRVSVNSSPWRPDFSRRQALDQASRGLMIYAFMLNTR